MSQADDDRDHHQENSNNAAEHNLNVARQTLRIGDRLFDHLADPISSSNGEQDRADCHKELPYGHVARTDWNGRRVKHINEVREDPEELQNRQNPERDDDRLRNAG